MSGKLEGRIAVVTGAGTGLGAAIAESLAAEGAHVAVHYRNSAAVQSRPQSGSAFVDERRQPFRATSPNGTTSSGWRETSWSVSAASTSSSTTSATWSRTRCRGGS